MGPRAGLDECGKSRPPIGIRSPDPPARSESIYRLNDPGPLYFSLYLLNLKLGVSQGRSRRLGDQINIRPLPGFEQPSIQPRRLVTVPTTRSLLFTPHSTS